MMGKVRKLRKKYRALCSNNGMKQPSAQIEASSLNPFLIGESQMNQLENVDTFDVGSTISISKSIKSCVTGIKKKQKQKLRRELFLNRIQVTRRTSDKITTRLRLNHDLPKASGKNSESKILNSQASQITMNTDKFKLNSKVRSKHLLNDIFLFKKNLKEDSFRDCPHETVTVKTLEKLGNECIYTERNPVNK